MQNSQSSYILRYFPDLNALENTESKNEVTIDIAVSQDPNGIEAGSTPLLECRTSESSHIWWAHGGRNLTTIKESEQYGRADIKFAKRNDTGNYTCYAQTISGKVLEKTIHVEIIGTRPSYTSSYLNDIITDLKRPS